MATKKDVPRAAVSGDTVTVHYTGTLDDGTQFDSSEGKEPITFKLGSGEVIPGFEKGIEGMKEGEEKKLDIAPEQAYGAVHAQLMHEVPLDKFPPHVELKKGMMLTMQAPTGQRLMARVEEVGKDSAKLDLNHPLAGKRLHFKVTLVKFA
jgi:FKBP-type peptidyl-prolyl cis-trans isomerase 2